MSQEREVPINNLIKAVEVHNEFYKEPRELFEWVKASEEKSNHQQRVCCRGLKHGHFFEASYDKSIDMYINYTSGTSSNRIPVDLIEWLKPITKPESITNSEGWVSVEDRLPFIKNDIGYEVIVCFGGEQDRGLSIFYKSKFYLAVTWSEEGPNSDEYPNVTHWQPLPAPPGEKSASLPTNKLTNSSIEQMAEEYDKNSSYLSNKKALNLKK